MLTREKYHDLRRLYVDKPRKQLHSNVELCGLFVDVPDCASFLSQVGDIFYEEQFKFETSIDSPVILDLGANIGLASLYFSKLFPNARIYSFEADPQIFEVLKRNISNNHIRNVTSYNQAVWIEKNTLCFDSVGTDAGRLNNQGKIQVDAMDLKVFISEFEKVDLLKIDIEGGENIVIPHIVDCLDRVERIICEYHSDKLEPQLLSGLLACLEAAGFRYHIHTVNKRNSPLINSVPHGNFDCQINIYGYKK